MTKLNIIKTTWIWLSVLILLVCVAATGIAFVSRLDTFLIDDEGAISLINEDAVGTTQSTGATKETLSSGTTTTQAPTTEQGDSNNSNAPGTQVTEAVTSATTPQVTRPPQNPGFEVGDDKTVWGTNTQVEIFRIFYENGEQIITVNSENGEKVIAPGTENSYTFKLKNTGNVALDYTVEVDAYFTPADITIPITGRLNRYDEKWIIGGKDVYATVPVLDTASDSATLGAGKYTYYTLDWQWPFESGNDELDTMLGNLATEQDLTFTIVIKTTATVSEDPDDDSGITPPPQTGDNTNLALLITIAISSFVIMVYLMFSQNSKKRCYDAEAD